MKTSSFKVAALAAALAMTAGCGKKAPREIPPPPAGSETETTRRQRRPAAVETGAGPPRCPDRARISSRTSAPTGSCSTPTAMRSTTTTGRCSIRRSHGCSANPSVRVTIEGHCDERGTREYNLALGDRRANAAKNYLAARGIDPSRMTVISWGKERPEALGSDESAWAQNRRAVTVVPNDYRSPSGEREANA